MAVGIRPNMQLAKEAGLAGNRGIVVDATMRTSDPDIFALGECAEADGQVFGLVAPLYEISKRLQGQLLSLRSLDLAGPQLRIRRLVLGPFRSALNPIGVMSAEFVAREVLRQAHWDWGLVIVTPNPLTYVVMPLAVLSRWLYFRVFSGGADN